MNSLSEDAYSLCLEIEKLDASEQQTRISCMASSLLARLRQMEKSKAADPVLVTSELPLQ